MISHPKTGGGGGEERGCVHLPVFARQATHLGSVQYIKAGFLVQKGFMMSVLSEDAANMYARVF